MKEIQRMYQHLHWANERLLSLLKGLPQDHPKARRLFSHILLAEQVWLSRLQRLDSSHLPIWETLELGACERLAGQNEAQFAVFLSRLHESDLDTLIPYKKSTGKEFNTSIRDILIHVALHGQYHRGQINAWIREGGFDPVNVDFITYVR